MRLALNVVEELVAALMAGSMDRAAVLCAQVSAEPPRGRWKKARTVGLAERLGRLLGLVDDPLPEDFEMFPKTLPVRLPYPGAWYPGMNTLEQTMRNELASALRSRYWRRKQTIFQTRDGGDGTIEAKDLADTVMATFLIPAKAQEWAAQRVGPDVPKDAGWSVFVEFERVGLGEVRYPQTADEWLRENPWV